MNVPCLLLAVAASVLLTACSPQMQDELTRDAARAAVRPVLEQRFPGVQVEFATDCVIDNASSGELLALAADAVTGPTANTVEIVSDVISRPATIECLAREGLPVLLTRL